jgi:hypothetical protein
MEALEMKRRFLPFLLLVLFTTSACALGPVVHEWLDRAVPSWSDSPMLHWVLGPYEEGTGESGEPASPGVEGVGQVLTDQMTISVYKGDASQFSTPPEVFFANYEEYSSPLGSTIYYQGTAYPFYTCLSFPDQGAWIALQTGDPIGAIGVQLWGDYEDGWVQVSVDGTPIWKGDTRYENCAFDPDGNRVVSPETCSGGFFYYIQASGLERTAHVIRAENTGGGQMTIYFFGTGLVKP